MCIYTASIFILKKKFSFQITHFNYLPLEFYIDVTSIKFNLIKNTIICDF